MRVVLDPMQQDVVRAVAARVFDTYTRALVAKSSYVPKNHEQKILNGLGGELAVATVLGGHWNEGDPFKADVDADLEVRTSQYADSDLPIYEKDRGDRRFIFVIGTFPTYELIGWITGVEAKRVEWWHPAGTLNSRGQPYSINMWTVPKSRLRSILEPFL